MEIDKELIADTIKKLNKSVPPNLLRPKCGFCKKEIKILKQMTQEKTTIHCCSECGAVLGVTEGE